MQTEERPANCFKRITNKFSLFQPTSVLNACTPCHTECAAIPLWGFKEQSQSRQGAGIAHAPQRGRANPRVASCCCCCDC